MGSPQGPDAVGAGAECPCGLPLAVADTSPRPPRCWPPSAPAPSRPSQPLSASRATASNTEFGAVDSPSDSAERLPSPPGGTVRAGG